ncbi:MAG: fatty acid desaturase family protein [Magnetovibrionaceae bacterium]
MLNPATNNRRLDAAPPVIANALLFSGAAAIIVYATLILPFWLLEPYPWLAWTLIPAALATPTSWAVLHEAIHGGLFPNRSANLRAGRVLSILFGSPFRLLRFGHLTHHKLSRTAFDRSEAYDPAKTSWLSATVYHFGRIFGGLYFAEVVASLLALLPRGQAEKMAIAFFGLPDAVREGEKLPDTGASAVKALVNGSNLREMRIDGIAALGLIALGFAAYGEQWMLFAGYFLARGFLISLLDNAPHYGTPISDRTWSYNLGLPGWAGALILYFNLHRVHHRAPYLPWNHLPRAFQASQDRFDGGYLALVAQQLRGPVPLARLRGLEIPKG